MRPFLIASAFTNGCRASCVAMRPLRRRRSAGVPAAGEWASVIRCRRKQLAVLYAGPFHVVHRLDFVIDDIACEPPINALVEKYLHEAAATRRSFACSRNSMTCSRSTEGNPARK